MAASGQDRLLAIRHSFSHVMAEAVLRMFPEAKVAIGPAIDDGFYYDFELPRTLTTEDLGTIEGSMREILAGDYPFRRAAIPRDKARALFAGQPYKLELIDGLPEGEEISTYTQDTFTDLCRGPHVGSTRELAADAFKLTSIAGAYWRGDEKNRMLQRIYGTAWESKADLDAHLAKLAEIEKRDHRRLGKDLDLFSVHDEAGAGLDLLAPEGRPGAPGHRGLLAPRAPEARLRDPVHSAHRQELAVGDLGAPRLLREKHVRAHLHRRGGLLPQADELPLPHHDVQERAALLPRPAPPLGGAGDRVPLREVGGAARAAPRARLHPGRRAHLLHPRADRGRDPGGPALLARDLEGLRLQRHQGVPRHPARRRGGRAGALGTGHRVAAEAPRSARASTW